MEKTFLFAKGLAKGQRSKNKKNNQTKKVAFSINVKFVQNLTIWDFNGVNFCGLYQFLTNFGDCVYWFYCWLQQQICFSECVLNKAAECSFSSSWTFYTRSRKSLRHIPKYEIHLGKSNGIRFVSFFLDLKAQKLPVVNIVSSVEIK